MREVHVSFDARDYGELLRARSTRSGDFSGVDFHRFRNYPPTRNSEPFLDFMTGEPCRSSFSDAVELGETRARFLRNCNVRVVRVKVECDASQFPQSDDDGYYESHAQVEGVPRIEFVPQEWRRRGVLLSRSLKSWNWHVTLRSAGCGLEVHRDRFSLALRVLHRDGVQVVSPPRHEYVEYDSFRANDAEWEKIDD